VTAKTADHGDGELLHRGAVDRVDLDRVVVGRAGLDRDVVGRAGLDRDVVDRAGLDRDVVDRRLGVRGLLRRLGAGVQHRGRALLRHGVVDLVAAIGADVLGLGAVDLAAVLGADVLRLGVVDLADDVAHLVVAVVEQRRIGASALLLGAGARVLVRALGAPDRDSDCSPLVRRL
jgi:hypothetical protein